MQLWKSGTWSVISTSLDPRVSESFYESYLQFGIQKSWLIYLRGGSTLNLYELNMQTVPARAISKAGLLVLLACLLPELFIQQTDTEDFITEN